MSITVEILDWAVVMLVHCLNLLVSFQHCCVWLLRSGILDCGSLLVVCRSDQ